LDRRHSVLPEICLRPEQMTGRPSHASTSEENFQFPPLSTAQRGMTYAWPCASVPPRCRLRRFFFVPSAVVLLRNLYEPAATTCVRIPPILHEGRGDVPGDDSPLTIICFPMAGGCNQRGSLERQAPHLFRTLYFVFLRSCHSNTFPKA